METLNLINRIEFISQASNHSRPRIYKDRVSPFSLPDVEFKKKYRFNKQTTVEYSEYLQVLVALRSWGRREVQDDAGDIHGLSQASVSRTCAKVERALAKLARDKIKMPSTVDDEVRISKQFKEIRNFHGVIGAIDGTHIKIKKTVDDLAQYYINGKGFYLLNVQIIK